MSYNFKGDAAGQNVSDKINLSYNSTYSALKVNLTNVDTTTNAVKVVDYPHNEIHAGDHYNYCDYNLGTASGVVINFVFTTPNTASWAHLIFALGSSTGATIQLYEGTTGISGGTAITPRNNNRNSAKTSGVTLLKDPTIVSDGTRAAGFVAGGTRTSGATSRENEYILKQNTSYLLRITSLANSNDISWCAEWYEHTNL